MCLAAVCVPGCRSPYYADRGALFGGLTGAGLGAIVGDATGGNAGTGAVIGAGLGALTGSAMGQAVDDIEAQNRAEIARQLGQPVRPGAATIRDVVAMSRAGVTERLIVTHIQNNGVAAPLTAADVIYLHQQGVAPNVIQAFQSPPPPAVAPPAVIVEQPTYGPGCHWSPRRYGGY